MSMIQRQDSGAAARAGSGSGAPSPGGTVRALRRALAYLRSYRRAAAGAFVALLVVTAANLVAPQLIRLAIDRGLSGRQWSVVLIGGGGLVGGARAPGAGTFLRGDLAGRGVTGGAW